MLLQADRVAEGFSADIAREGPRATVRPPHVNFQSMRGRKHLLKKQKHNRLEVSLNSSDLV